MAASRMCQGVTKSGSPIPSEMTPCIDWTISKKSRMPERGMSRTWSAIKPGEEAVGTVERGRCMGLAGRLVTARFPLRTDLEAFFVHDAFAQNALDLVGLEIEVGGRGEDAGEGGEFFGNEAGDLLERVALDEDEQVEAAAHEETGL